MQISMGTFIAIACQGEVGEGTPTNTGAPTLNASQIIGADPGYVAGTWSSGTPAFTRYESSSDGSTWATAAAMPDVDSPPTDAEFGKVLRVIETNGGVEAASAATGAVWIANLYHFAPDAGLYQDSALTTPATALDDLVGGMVEQSGSGINGASSSTFRPKLKPDGFGTGLPGLLYEGAQYIDANGLAAALSGSDKPYTDVVAVKLTDVASFYVLIGGGSSVSSAMRFRNNSFITPSWGIERRDDTTAAAFQQGGTANTNAHVVTFIFTGTTCTVRVDGVVVINNAALNVGTATFDRWTMGASRAVGSLVGPAKALLGDVYHAPRVLTAGEIDALEAAVAPRCGLAYPFDLLELVTPPAHRVFQRSGATGDIAITGVIHAGGTHDIEARFNGGAWTTIASSESGAFSGTLTGQPQGRGTLELRMADAPDDVISRANIGIGDVYGIFGQSNASGRGTNLQAFTDSGGLGASVFGNDYNWKALADPVDSVESQADGVSSDSQAAGSVWPLVASGYVAEVGVPVAFVPCAKGATFISQWLPGANHLNRSTLYGSANYRLQQTGCRAILWWQGEHDTVDTTQEDYNAALDTIADALMTDLGVKLMPCKLQNNTGAVQEGEDRINAAIEEAWSDNPNVLTGPDLTGISTDIDGFHLGGNTALANAAALWLAAMEAAL